MVCENPRRLATSEMVESYVAKLTGPENAPIGLQAIREIFRLQVISNAMFLPKREEGIRI